MVYWPDQWWDEHPPIATVKPLKPMADSVIAQIARRSAERAAARAGRGCKHCGKPLTALRGTRRFCSDACRQAAYRARIDATPAAT